MNSTTDYDVDYFDGLFTDYTAPPNAQMAKYHVVRYYVNHVVIPVVLAFGAVGNVVVLRRLVVARQRQTMNTGGLFQSSVGSLRALTAPGPRDLGPRWLRDQRELGPWELLTYNHGPWSSMTQWPWSWGPGTSSGTRGPSFLGSQRPWSAWTEGRWSMAPPTFGAVISCRSNSFIHLRPAVLPRWHPICPAVYTWTGCRCADTPLQHVSGSASQSVSVFEYLDCSTGRRRTLLRCRQPTEGANVSQGKTFSLLTILYYGKRSGS